MVGVLALILAGGKGSRLSLLTWKRAKPSVTFGGKYRLIDFTLSNAVNSGIGQVGVLVQYCPESIRDHVGSGKPWDLDRGGLHVLYPRTRRGTTSQYLGTADAVYKNLGFVEDSGADVVVILAGDHIYRMDYSQMVASHMGTGADMTVGVVEVPQEECHRFGMVTLGSGNRVTEFQEKPTQAQSNLASMGIYAFSARVLREALVECVRDNPGAVDFGGHILPYMVSRYQVAAYPFTGYWRDVGTVDSYWQANMELFTPSPLVGLFQGEWRVRTRHQDYPPARLGPAARVNQNIICNGCEIGGSIGHSILSRGVVVEEGAEVVDSVLVENVRVKQGARVHRAIIGEGAVIGDNAVVGDGDDYTPNQDEPEVLNTGLTLVGERARVPRGAVVGRNCRIAPGASREDFPEDGILRSGSSVEADTVPAESQG